MEQFQKLKQQLQETVRQRMDMSSGCTDWGNHRFGHYGKKQGSLYECGYEADTAAGIVQCDPETGSFVGAD